MFRLMIKASLLVLLTFGYADADDPPAVFSSGEQQVALVELFTSEGCNSCPPADRWLSGLKTDSGLWTRFVPVAFHVDYWDYIGWKDRFARAEYSTRQRQYAKEGAAQFVYTPGVFYQGQDWRGWRNRGPAAIDADAAGDLTVRVENSSVAIRFNSLDPDVEQLTAHIALLGMNLETSVRAGENKGRTLRHDFVALDVVSSRLHGSGPVFTATATLPETPPDVADVALAVWIAEAGAQTPIQSVGGFLPSQSR